MKAVYDSTGPARSRPKQAVLPPAVATRPQTRDREDGNARGARPPMRSIARQFAGLMSVAMTSGAVGTAATADCRLLTGDCSPAYGYFAFPPPSALPGDGEDAAGFESLAFDSAGFASAGFASLEPPDAALLSDSALLR